MIKQIKKGRYRSDKHFIIEISFILPNKRKKIVISLFISDNIKVKELREFISKDFNIPINTLKFFYPLEGFLEDSYEFQFEQDKKINLDLILNAPKESAFDSNYRNVSKKEENQKRINDFFKIISQKQEIVNSRNVQKETNLLNNQNSLKYSINIGNNDKNESKDKEKSDENKRIYWNNFLKDYNDKNNGTNQIFLNKKRFESSHKPIKSQNQKNYSKIEIKNNKNIKIINFNINKSLDGVKVNKIN